MHRSQRVAPSSSALLLLARGARKEAKSFHSSSSSQQSKKVYEMARTETMDSSSSSSRWADMFERNSPVLIKGLVSKWPAVSDEAYRWVNGRRFEEVDKGCFVPVEIGRNYMDSGLNIAHMEFGEVASYLLAGDSDGDQQEKKSEMASNARSMRSKGKGDGRGRGRREREDLSTEYMSRTFLAQHALNEIPTLEDDVRPFPELVLTGKGHLYRSNIWFGGAEGSESPCHRDPFHNVLCQVFGEKRVILFAPTEEEYLYPAVGTVQKNTSLVDISSPDLSKHPLFQQATGLTTTLQPGDGLYIPKGWFHYCATTSKSCSVNFWWL